MATIPFQGEPTVKLRPLSTPGFRNTATIENLERGEMELAEQFKVPVEKLENLL